MTSRKFFSWQRIHLVLCLQVSIFAVCMSFITGRFITEYFPSILTLRQMMPMDYVLIEYDETYQKNSLRNRCYLAGSQGVHLLSVPLIKGKHQQLPIYQVRIAYDENWSDKHLRFIETNYNKSPYYSHYIDEVRGILLSRPVFLIDLNWNILQFLSRSFQWNPSWGCSLQHGESINHHHHHHPRPDLKPYPQVFEDRLGFLPNLSILDLLFCIGPQQKYIV